MYDLTRIRSIIDTAHKGQVDKAGRPYVEHLLAVRKLLPEDATPLEKAAALLHDVLEDTTMLVDDLRDEFDEHDGGALVEVIGLLTRPEGRTYFDYIRRIAYSGNASAVRVKIADLRHNLGRGKIPGSLMARYTGALALLLELGEGQ